MKTNRLILIYVICLVFPGILGAQSYTEEFGTPKLEQLTMTSYDRDNLAEAVVLYDIGNTYFTDTESGFRIVFERTTKVKIFSKAGLDHAEVEIPFYVENSLIERVYDIEGNTYNIENGVVNKTKLDIKTTYEEKISDRWKVLKFAMPDVQEGSVIEYRYKVISPYFFNLHDWEFQSKIPAIYSEYTVRMVPFYEYSYILQGASKFDVFRNTETLIKRNYLGVEYPDNIYTFGLKNVPAFRDEEFITSINDYIIKMDFQLSVVHHPNGAKVNVMTTWPLLNQELLKNSDFGGFLKGATKSAAEILPALSLESKTDREKAEVINAYVKANFNWNGSKDKLSSQTIKDFIRLKTGNSADINLFLCGMLNASGIQAFPVVLSTRDHGKIAMDYPFQQFMNYVVVSVDLDNKPVLLDATEPLSTFGMLPARCMNEKGLVVNKEKVEWVSLTDNVNSIETDSVHIMLNASTDSAYTDIHIQTLGHQALDYRRSYFSDPDAFREGFVGSDWEITKTVAVEHEKDILEPFLIQYGTRLPIETVGNKLLISPFPGLTPVENPLKMGFRNYPVDMIYPETNNFIAVIEIPKGYVWLDQQKSVVIDNALVALSYHVESNSNQILVKGMYAFKKAVYLRHEYYDLKSYYARLVETFNNKIVLEKQSE